MWRESDGIAGQNLTQVLLARVAMPPFSGLGNRRIDVSAIGDLTRRQSHGHTVTTNSLRCGQQMHTYVATAPPLYR